MVSVSPESSSVDYVYIDCDLVEENSSRTIIAPSIDLSDSSYCFYIWGKSTKTVLVPQKVDFSSTSSDLGTIPLDFPIAAYYFTLAVTTEELDNISDGSSILEKAVLVAYTSADLSYSTTVRFHLSTNGLKSYGNMNFSFCLDDSWSDAEIAELNADYNITAGLFELGTGTSVSSFPSVSLSNLSSSSLVSLSTYSAVAGTYNLVVSMEKKDKSSTYSYSDTVIVSPNLTITETVYLPNVLVYSPAAPSNFKVAYCLDERIYRDKIVVSDGALSSEDVEPTDVNEYAVLFSWEDNSYNESHFRLTLVDVSAMATMPSVPSVMTDSAWNQIVAGYSGNSSVMKIYDESCSESDECFAGSLEKNSTSLILYASFGKCYIAKIEAVNDAGVSTACYASLGDSFDVEVYDEDYGNSTAVYSGTAFSTAENPCSLINLYRVVYDFSGGSLEYYESGTLKTETGYIVEYGNYGSYEFFTPITDLSSATKENPALLYLSDEENGSFSYGSRWTHWKVNSIYGDNLIDTEVGGNSVYVDGSYTYQKPGGYAGFKSLYLCACYD